MKIGVWLNNRIKATIGGGASYSNRLVYLLDNYQFAENVEICFFSVIPIEGLKKEVICISQLPSIIYKLFAWSDFATNKIQGLDRRLVMMRGLKRVLKGTDIKLVYYIQQAFTLDSSFPSVHNNWDIGHRSTFPFPEVMDEGEFEYREKFYQKQLPKALMIICESETGKQELIDYTNIGSHKIRVMPIFAGSVSSLTIPDNRIKEILCKFGLESKRFFYYPAQFWAHKNHVGLLKAFREFINQVDDGHKLVLSGSNVGGNREYVEQVAIQLGILDKVVFLGFISEEEVYSLYCNATCLVMASHFGPTNMPPIEAMELNCPVVCSDIGGHREILGDAAVYFNSFDYMSIFEGIKDVYNNREKYQNRIVIQKTKTLFNSDYAIKRLDEILQEVVVIRSNWE